MVYPSTMSDRMEPPVEPEPTHRECWAECANRDACETTWRVACESFGVPSAAGEMPERMRCGEDCGNWEEA